MTRSTGSDRISRRDVAARGPWSAPRAPGRSVRLSAVGALVLSLAVCVSCGPRPRVPRGIAPPPEPFDRVPYLQSAQADSVVVRWRTAPGVGSSVRWREAGGSWRTASVERLGRGDRRAVLSGLPRGRPVEYEVSAGDVGVGPYTFRAAPGDTSSAAVRVLGFGDSGWGSTAQVALARLMRGRSWDLAVHVGDIAYPDGSERDLTVRHFDVYGDLFVTVPFFPVAGNHDVRTAGGRPYDRAFDWPGDRDPVEGGPEPYSFRWGRVAFFALSTAKGASRDSLAREVGAQYRWLRDGLAATARDTTVAWTVVVTHYPLYSHAAGIAGHGPNEELREALEPLLLEHGVDLVLAGHDHHYERSRPLREGRVEEPGCAPVHMIIGGGGAQRFARSVAPDEQVARIDRSYHFLDLAFRPAAAVGEATGPDDDVFDRFRVLPYEPSAGKEERCD